MTRDTQEGSHSDTGVNTLLLARPLLNSPFKRAGRGGARVRRRKEEESMMPDCS